MHDILPRARLPPKRATSDSNIFAFRNKLAEKSIMGNGFNTARSKGDTDTMSNVGPANYNIERVIGRKNIV